MPAQENIQPPGDLLLARLVLFFRTRYILSSFLTYPPSLGVKVVVTVFVSLTYGPVMSFRSLRRRVCSNNSSWKEWSIYFLMMMNSSSRFRTICQLQSCVTVKLFVLFRDVNPASRIRGMLQMACRLDENKTTTQKTQCATLHKTQRTRTQG
jgi:hypothetical protein